MLLEKPKRQPWPLNLREPVMLPGSVRRAQVMAREHTQGHILMMHDSTEHITSTNMEAFEVRETLPCAKTSQGRKLRWALMYSSKEYTFWMGGLQVGSLVGVLEERPSGRQKLEPRVSFLHSPEAL